LESQRQISTEEGQKLAAKWNIRLIETSTKTRHNVREVFEHFVRCFRAQNNHSSNSNSSRKRKFSKKCTLL
jgi:hypothetical protein